MVSSRAVASARMASIGAGAVAVFGGVGVFIVPITYPSFRRKPESNIVIAATVTEPATIDSGLRRNDG